MRVLSVNVGSSSLKLAWFEADASSERRVASASVSDVGPDARLVLHAVDDAGERRELCSQKLVSGEDAGRDVHEAGGVTHHAAQALTRVLDVAASHGLGAPDAAGHRIVHGGPDHVAPQRVTDALVAELEALEPFAPLHLPAEIAVVRALARRAPELPQVVCFDTAFHQRMPAAARRLPLPRALWDKGVRRYGFHGLSYEYVLGALPDGARGRIVIAHLGNGASLAAVRDGLPIDTTMGLTPTGGLMMGTRSGDLDPGVLFHLARVEGWDVERLQRLVEAESGLLGVSGESSDVRTLLARRATSAAADEAIELFCWIARRHVGAMAASLGGVDQLVFTGGIGEHAAEIRAGICTGLEHLGVRLDPERNARNAAVVSADASPCTVRVVATDEERVIARHTRARVAGGV